MIYLWVVAVQGSHSYLSFSGMRRLFEDLADDPRHADVRPAENQLQPTTVSIICVVQDFEIYDTENRLEVNMLFLFYWYDETLSWNTSEYSNNQIFMKKKDFSLWNPTILLRNAIGQKSYLGNLTNLYGVALYSFGSVDMFGHHRFKSHCEIDMTYFPFDAQECSFEITSWPSEIQFLYSLCTMENSNSKWTDSEVSYTLSNTSLICTIRANRKPTFLIINLIVPTVLIGFLNVFVFIVPSKAGEKLQYSVSILLSFNVYTGILVDNVPANSENMSFLSYYITYQYVFGVVVITVTAVLLRTVHSNESKTIPRNCLFVVKIVDFMTCKRRCLFGKVRVRDNEACGAENNIGQSVRRNEVTWKAVCAAFDFLLFWLFFLIQVFGNIGFFLSLKGVKVLGN